MDVTDQAPLDGFKLLLFGVLPASPAGRASARVREDTDTRNGAWSWTRL